MRINKVLIVLSVIGIAWCASAWASDLQVVEQDKQPATVEQTTVSNAVIAPVSDVAALTAAPEAAQEVKSEAPKSTQPEAKLVRAEDDKSTPVRIAPKFTAA